MNQHQYRLVFSRRLGMFVAVSEQARSQGRSSGESRPGRCTVAAALLALGAATATTTATTAAWAQARPPVVFAGRLPAPQQALPQPSASRVFAYDPAKGPATELRNNGVSWTVNGNTAVFDQGSVNRVVVNWDSFDIAAGHTVRFVQNSDPGQYVSALNRIWSADPSQILGRLEANREVILLNSNGVYFGRGARVDTGKFIASSLAIADSQFEKGLRNITDGSAVFSSAGADYRATDLSSAVTVEGGAEIRAAAGGDVLLFAPRVVNQGRIETPKGQTVLAAGDKVYLMSSSDPAQRGLIVAVDPVKLAGSTANDPELGLAENAASGSYKTRDGATVADATPDATAGLVQRLNEIRAESGSVNLVGLTVRQGGQINATTAVKGANGAIYLQAMASTVALAGGSQPSAPALRRGLTVEAGATVRAGGGGGTVEVAAGSQTLVMPAPGAETQLDAEVFNPSRIRIEGGSIAVAGGARIVAPAGQIELLAAQNAATSPLFDSQSLSFNAAPDSSRVVVAPDALISVAGLQGVAVDGARNQGEQRLFRIELADAPVQRSGPLYRSTVFFDLRDAAAISVANLGGAAAALTRSAAERSTAGGSLRIESEGAVVIAAGAQLDVSGGSVYYSQATLQNSLVERNGQLVLLRAAPAGNRIDRLLGDPARSLVPAYTEGARGGALLLNGRSLAVAGRIDGAVTLGERQRTGTRPAPAALTLGRQQGLAYYLPALNLEPGAAVALDAALQAALLTDPLGASLAGLPASTSLSLQAVAAGGFGALNLRAAAITQDAPGALALGAGGSLDLRAERIALDGAYSAPGGSIALATTRADGAGDLGDIRLSARTRLDTAGRWTNEGLGAGTATDPGIVQTGGGTVTATAAHSLLVETGAQIDVSAGARLAASGALTRGSAGSISLAAGRSDLFATVLQIEGVALSGFDFASGGTLSLGTQALSLGGNAAAGTFTLAPAFFSEHGFGSISVSAFGDVRLAGGTELAPALATWQLAPGYRSAPSGAMAGEVGAAVATPVVVDEAVADRRPVNLTLAATRTLNPGAGQPGGSLVVERGAAIRLEDGASLTLSATRNLEIGASGGQPGQTATLAAPGGQIRLAINGVRGAISQISAGDDPAGFIADQALWLGGGARLSVAGAAELRRENTAPAIAAPLSGGTSGSNERLGGSVLGGGNITLEAQRGYVVADAGSQMALDGAAATLNWKGSAQPLQLARPAGTLKIASVEGIVLDGTVSAQPPRSADGQALADGGRLDIAIGLGGINNFSSATAYPGTLLDPSGQPIPGAVARPRTLLVGDYTGLLSASGAVHGSDLNAALGNGLAYVPTRLLNGAGFDALRLGAGDAVRLEASIASFKPLGIVIDAPALQARPGVQATLGGATLSLGDRSLSRQGDAPNKTAAADTAPAADTRLTLRAPTIEIVGASALQGFSNVALDAGASAEGEIRFSAIAPALVALPSATVGRLAFAGALELTAGQIYATTGTGFTLAGLPAGDASDAGSRITLSTGTGGASAQAPLSAFGALSLQATDIDHGGALRQPFGAIELKAGRELTLRDGSLTSVSGAGSTLIYGSTDNLAQWLLPSGQTSSALPLAKGVSLSAARLNTAPGARVEAGGGGDIQAWEFFSGVGGSRDALLGDGLYALLPDRARAPALAFNGGVVPEGAAKELVLSQAAGGLAAGSYTLLPARFALLGARLPQGAFLVRRAADPGRSLLEAPLAQDDGSFIVQASLRDIGSAFAGLPGERFVIEPQASFQARSEIRLSSVSELLAGRAATLGSAATPDLPRDGGRVQIASSGSERSLWQAGLGLGAGSGRAGTLDVTAARLALVDDLAKTPDAALGLSAQVLADSGAGSVLLGARRSLDAATAADAQPRYTLDSSATRAVTVDLGDRALKLEELVLAASGSVELAAGTRIDASATATLGARTLAASGDGALALVSANAVALERGGVSLAGGSLSLGENTVLSGATLGLDATAGLQLASSAGLTADALSLGARRIVVGEGTAPAAGDTQLAGALLDTVRDAPALTLRSYTSIDFVGTQDWAQRPTADAAPARVQRSLVLDAPLLRGLAGADGTPARTDIAARRIVLRNTSGQALPAQAGGQGSLLLQALPPLQAGSTGGLTLGPGALALGFDDSLLRSGGDIVLAGNGRTSAQGDFTLSAARLTATTAAEQALAADAGTLRIVAEAGARTLGERAGQGASLTLSARRVEQAGVVDLAGGQLAINAAGSGVSLGADSTAVAFAAGSLTSVAGFAIQGDDGHEVFGHAGQISASAASGGIAWAGTLDVAAARRADGSAGMGDGGSVALRAAGRALQLTGATLR
ncbi:filamentous hemagglutinin N-terminal domain-containing protein, partial [Rubrivivax sp. A210]|uniref:two-partner secretion domain-containing protein n=1 Tax=Rubrivivax sp. A210 TaxID=2772301 RepID=UPI00191B0562